MGTELHENAKALVAEGKGILAADESTSTIKKRFDSIGLESTEDNRRAYRELLFTTPGVEEYISGVILYDETIRQSASDGMPFPKLLASQGDHPRHQGRPGREAARAAPRARRSPRGSTACASGSRSTTSSARASQVARDVLDRRDERPSEYCVWTNAHALARYAALCQEAGIVPIVEPEVLMDGDALDRASGEGDRPRPAGAVHRAPRPARRPLGDAAEAEHGARAATRRATAPGSTRSPRRPSTSSTGTCRRRCRGSSSSPAARPTRTRPRT